MTAPTDARVLITGASGFLGAYVARELAEHGYEPFLSGRQREILAQRADPQHVIPATLRELSTTDLPVDAVVHCAALSTPWGRYRDFAEANVEGTRHAYEFARRNGATTFVHISSPSIYAALRDRVNIAEDDVDPRNRLNGYIRSKIAAEEFLRAVPHGGPRVVILRPRGLIGQGDPSLIPRLIDVHDRIGIPLFRGGENLIDVTAVENVALAARLALTHGEHLRAYNITNGEPRAFRELLASLLSQAGITPRFRQLPLPVVSGIAAALESVCEVIPGRPEPPLTRYTLSTIAYSQTLDISRARAELGYEPRVSLDGALHRVAVGLREGT